MDDEQTMGPAPFGFSMREAAEQLGVNPKTLSRRIVDVRTETGQDKVGLTEVEGRKLGFRKIAGRNGVETRWFMDIETVEEMPEPPQPTRQQALKNTENEVLSSVKSALDTFGGEALAAYKANVDTLKEQIALQAESHARELASKDQTISILQTQVDELKPAAREAEALRRRLEEEERSREAAESKIAQLEGTIYALNPPDPEPTEGEGVGEEPPGRPWWKFW